MSAAGIGTAASGALMYLTDALNKRALGRRTPAKRSSGAAADQLEQGYQKRVDEIGSGRKPQTIDLIETVPDDNFNPYSPFVNTDDFASNSIASDGHNPVVYINPNVDEAYLAHELGHITSDQTDIGHLIRKLRDNPKLTEALGHSMMILPGAAAALESGDNDMDTSIALAAAAGLPTLIDEGLATHHGLKIMDAANRPATWGQKGRLAGAFLSYLTPAIVAGTAGNLIGNQFD